MPVSESQKQGVSASGCRFSEKAEHVPIKKRRFLFRSPSPPPVITSPPIEEDVVLTNSEDVSKSATCEINLRPGDKDSNIVVKNTDKSDGKFADDEENVVLTKSEEISKSAICESSLRPNDKDSNIVVKNTVKSATSESNLRPNDKDSNIVVKNTVKPEEKFVEDEDFSGISILAAAACSTSFGGEFGYAEHGTAIEDTSMLLRPCEVSTSIKTGSLPKKELLKEELISSSEMSTGGTLSCISTEPVGELVSISTAINLPSEVTIGAGSLTSSGIASWRKDEEMMDIQKESSRDVKFHWDLNVVMDAWEEPLDDTGVHNVPHTQDALKNNRDSHDKSVCHNVDQRFHLGVTASDHAITKPSTSGGLNEADTTTAKTLNVNAEKGNYDQLDLIDDSRVENLSTVSELDILRDATQNVSDGKILPHSSIMCSEASNSVSTTCELQIALGTKVQEVSNVCGGNFLLNSLDTTGFPEIHPMDPKESSDSHFGETSKASLLKCLKYSKRGDNEERAEYDDEMSIRRDITSGHREDYDSQYEDGELRESNELAWEEYDDVDREHEHVDYGSDNTGTCINYPSDYHDFESGQVVSSGNCHVNEAAIAVEDYRGNDKDKDKLNLRLSSVEKMKVFGQQENSKSCSDIATGVIDDNGKMDRLATHVDALVDSKGTETTEEPKVFRRPLLSRIEGPISRDGPSRDDRPFRTENRFQSGSTRSFERGRYSYHNQGRGRQGPSDYHRGYKRHYSPINNRRSKINDDGVIERDDIGCDGNRDDLSYSHQLPNSRKFSPDRGSGYGRGRPFRYGPMGRGRPNGPSPDESFQSSLKHRRPFSGRERSLSPFRGRGQSNMNHSRGKSLSRSRSRSPIVWDFPRERPTGPGRGGRTFIRNRSRSPNFRSEARIQRQRSPNQQPGFGEFRSITRTHGSSPRNKFNSDRRDEMGNFRDFGYKQRTTPLERSSPGRFRSRGDRDNVIGSPRNLKPDGYCRFSDRISEDDSGRGLRYADNYEERRKPPSFPRPGRRDYEDGMASRLHQDMDDGFSNTNNTRNRDAPRFRGRGGFRGIDNRISDDRRTFRGVERSFEYERDGKFNSNSKEFTNDVMDSSRNQKSEDQFHPNHTGRYDMGGTNQRHRYDNYEGRRKQYGTSNYMRRTDNDGAEERLNQNPDGNFEDAPNFVGSATRGFERQSGIASRLKENAER